MKRVYLAGPDVFGKDPKWVGSHLKERLAKLGLIGMFPLDNEASESKTIYELNVESIRSCDGVLANVMPFRGPSIDVGTAFEIGYAKALGKPVVGYFADFLYYKDRIAHFHQDLVSAEFPAIEDFGLFDNLMIACGCDLVFNTWSSVDEAAEALKTLMEKN